MPRIRWSSTRRRPSAMADPSILAKPGQSRIHRLDTPKPLKPKGVANLSNLPPLLEGRGVFGGKSFFFSFRIDRYDRLDTTSDYSGLRASNLRKRDWPPRHRDMPARSACKQTQAVFMRGASFPHGALPRIVTEQPVGDYVARRTHLGLAAGGDGRGWLPPSRSSQFGNDTAGPPAGGLAPRMSVIMGTPVRVRRR